MSSISAAQKPRECFLFALAAVSGLAFFHRIFGEFFPNSSDRMGVDFTYFLPRLLDGYFWWRGNGFFSVPWFTPSFCGGLPAFANPQNIYYSVPQALTMFTDPATSVYWTILIFEFLGFAGFYLLLRWPFKLTAGPSIFGGLLFMFNGFYIHRLLTGQLAYHAYMLLPLACFLLLRPLPDDGGGRRGGLMADVILAGMIFAYMVYSGMNSLGVPALISIALIGVIHGMLHGKDAGFWLRLAMSGAVGVALAASKLAAMGVFFHQYPRADYPSLGPDSPAKLAWILVQTLFFWPDKRLIQGTAMLVGAKRYVMGLPYYEFGVSAAAALIILVGILEGARMIYREGWRPDFTTAQAMRWMALVVLCAIPLALAYNFKSPALAAFIRKIPVIGSHTHFTTWFMIFMPPLILAPPVILDNPRIKSIGGALILIGLLELAAQTAWRDRAVYKRQYYDYHPITDSYRAARAGQFTPGVNELEKYGRVMRSWAANSAAPLGGDDSLTRNASAMLCYEPIFGYWREKFPLGTLKTGPAMAEEGGRLNLKNPACFIFPEENGCKPGDHFTTGQRNEAESFRLYKPFEYRSPAWQRMANWITAVSALLSIGSLALYFSVGRGGGRE
jgi:hypothetical protein